MMLDVHLWTETHDVKDALEEGLQTLFLLARSFMKQQSPQASRSAALSSSVCNIYVNCC